MERDTVQDPVCGMRLSRTDAAAATQWSGRRYYFCSEACKRSFEADPARHVQARGEEVGLVVRVPVVGLPCVAGDRLPVERALRSVVGVLDAYVNPVDEAAYLTVDPSRFRMVDAIAEIERFGARAIVTQSERRAAKKAR